MSCPNGIEGHPLQITTKTTTLRIVFELLGDSEETQQDVLKNIIRILSPESGVACETRDDPGVLFGEFGPTQLTIQRSI